ncbi:type III polyketide synthase [Acetonema longum]|uniref:Naringenin-chalcone synthase n=1 Tax=Acetonema longum DSM 6540 TaxID=1009370 RepID=F7NDK8_9FIRM|nr:3-oxoacyl-[acyl-carrier-protein] synthase III C-terminal domain-containing protein [Acetonema longum]EGO65870.1 naringenin-chalcone synthase [Acetonema longum DSM 6540]
MGKPQIMSVGTAIPPYALGQEKIKEFAATLFQAKLDHLDRLLGVFENSLIKVRHLSRPLAWYQEAHSFAEANKVYEETAVALGGEAASKAIRQAGVRPEEIGAVIYISSTGIATPTVDVKIIQKLGLSPHTVRIPIWGLGCAGGVSGLARAAELAQVSGKVVLLIAVELCSLTFQRNDYSKANLVGASLFGDGAAAALIAVDGGGPAVYGSYSTLFPGTEDIMGWDVAESGLKVRFSRDIPTIVRRYLPELTGKACEAWNIDIHSVQHYVVHPGGAKVLEAYANSLKLPDGSLNHAYRVLAACGNMSSASVLFVLDRFLAVTPPTRQYGLMLALGPGFSAEQVLFQW